MIDKNVDQKDDQQKEEEFRARLSGIAADFSESRKNGQKRSQRCSFNSHRSNQMDSGSVKDISLLKDNYLLVS